MQERQRAVADGIIGGTVADYNANANANVKAASRNMTGYLA